MRASSPPADAPPAPVPGGALAPPPAPASPAPDPRPHGPDRQRRPTALWTRVSQWTAAHPLAVDVLFALTIGVMTLAGFLAAESAGSQRGHDVGGWLIIVGQTVCFTARRVAPLRSMLGVIVFTIAFWVADYPTTFDAFSLLAVYSGAAHGGPNRTRTWWVVGSTVAVLTAIALLGVLVPSEDLPALAVFGIAAIHLTAAVIGQIVYDRRQALLRLEVRARRAEAERERLAHEAVRAERARIARDLHDIVAHAMSVMVVQAGAAERVVGTRPDRAEQALAAIQSTGREALHEMRRMLGVLRDEGAAIELAPQPTMDDIDAIVRHCVDAGIPTALTVEGERPDHAAGPEMVGYRIVQEALTNVMKHAGRPVHAAVQVRYDPDRIRIEVTDDGLGATMTEVESATGHGLIGMRERVDLYHGTLHTGPRPGGGFRVAATIPLDGERP